MTMRAGRVLLLSAVVHGVLAAVLSQVVLEGKRVAVRPPEPEPEREPIEIAFVETPTPISPSVPAIESQPATPAHGPGATHAHAAAAIVASSSESSGRMDAAGETAKPSNDGTASGHGFMRMRGAELGLDPGVAERIAAGGDHELPGELKKSGRMTPVSGGKAVIYDRVTTVSVEQDGTAHFDDKPDFDVHWKLPIPHLDVEGMRKDLGEQLTKWYADPYAATRFGRTQDLSNINLAVPGACDEWGSIWCDDPLAPDAEKYAREQKKTNGSILGGSADITDYLHRKFVGEEFRAQQLVRSAELIDRNLRRLETARLEPIEVRAAAFELWDECAEPREHADDDLDADAEGQAGLRARVQVIGWIRSHLPQTSPDAYSDEEIVRLNLHRSSKQRFEPY